MAFEHIKIESTNPFQLGGDHFSENIAGNRIFNIPSYQRSYKWDEEDFLALLKDLKELQVNSDHQGEKKSHYMGNLFFWNDAKRVDKPAFHVIDGQQRLTTCIIFLSFVFFEFQTCPIPDGEQSGIGKRHKDLRDKFLNLILRKVTEQNNDFAFRSRFVSDGFDLPLTRFITHLIGGKSPSDPDFEFNDPSEFTPQADNDDARNFVSSLKKAESCLFKKLSKPPEEVLHKRGEEVGAYRRELLGLVIKIMEGLQFGLISVHEEQEAYKVFINLNAKGKPLTQFEVFCARIDTKLNDIRKQNSQAYNRIRGVLLPKLATALRGLKKDGVTPNAPNNKREDENFEELLKYWRVLNKSYSVWFVNDPIQSLVDEIAPEGVPNVVTTGEIEETLNEMLQIQNFINLPSVNGIKEDDSDQHQKMCLSILDYWPMGIHLVLPFYLRRDCIGTSYTSVLKKITAFWVLYRMVQPNRNTGDIQNTYKEWQFRGQTEKDAGEVRMKDILLTDLGRGLKKKLNNFGHRGVLPVEDDGWSMGPGMHQLINAWAEHASMIQSNQEKVNRTLLMFAYHNTVPRIEENGNPNIDLVGAPDPAQKNRLTYSFYEAFVGNGTLEHVRPQNPKPDDPWRDFDEASLRLIGNMHLAPSATNNSLTNSGPRTKKFLYRFWSTSDNELRKQYRAEMEVAGLDVDQAENLDLGVDHEIFELVFNWYQWDPTAEVQPPVWNTLAVKKRGLALCKRAVKNLLDWLNTA